MRQITRKIYEQKQRHGYISTGYVDADGYYRTDGPPHMLTMDEKTGATCLQEFIVVECTKRAWIRNQDAPIGKPAFGRINCPCGGAPETAFTPDIGNVVCACGTVYTWDGWII